MAIKQLIELIGDDVVLAKLRNLGKEAGQALGAVGTGDLKLDAKPIEDFTGKALKLKDALHTLQPILKAAGLQIGELGAFARLASNNIVLLGVAVAGAVTVGLAKLGENAERAKGQLDDAFGGRGRGQQALAALNKQAQEFGSTVTGLAPGLESFQTALNNVDRSARGFIALKAEDLPGASLAANADKVSQAYGNFIKLLRAGRLTQDEAEKSAKAFFDTLKDGGPITSASLKSLPVGTVKELQAAFGAAGLTTKAFFEGIDAGKITLDDFQRALQEFGPQAQRAFDAKAVKTIGDELGKLGVTLTQGIPNLTSAASTAVNFFLGATRGLLQAVLLVTEDVIEKATSAIAKLQLLNKSTFIGPTIEQGGPAKGPGIGKEAGFTALFPTPEQAGRAGAEAGTLFGKNFIQNLAGPSGVEGGVPKGFINNVNTAIKAAAEETPITIPVTPTLSPEKLAALRAEFDPELAGIVESFKESGSESATGFVNGLSPIAGQIQSLAQSWWQAIQSVFNSPIQVQFQSNSFLAQQPTSLAGGGMVRGPGSTTSDSVLAWLSNQEFVVNARAVSHYGPALFAALNAMRLPKDFIGKFAMGGLARSLSGNRFAAGGQVRSGNPVVLKIDRQSFNMTAGDDTISQLKRFAVTAQISSTGRKPRWVK